jgi:hypothetical protein
MTGSSKSASSGTSYITGSVLSSRIVTVSWEERVDGSRALTLPNGLFYPRVQLAVSRQSPWPSLGQSRWLPALPERPSEKSGRVQGTATPLERAGWSTIEDTPTR